MNNDAKEQVREILEAYRAHCDNEKGCAACEYQGMTDCGVAFTMDWMRPRATTKSRKDLAPAANDDQADTLAQIRDKVTAKRDEIQAYFDKKEGEAAGDFDTLLGNIYSMNRARGAIAAFDEVLAMLDGTDEQPETTNEEGGDE